MRFSPEFPFETPRVRLVPVQAHHADFIWDWSRDPRFNEHVLWRQPKVRLQAKLFVDSAIAAWKAGVGFSYFGQAKDTGLTVARVEARTSRRRGRIGEVGMLIAPSVWRQGLATELAYFGLWFCFENLEVEAVSIDAGPTNEASNRLLAGLGMHFLGVQEFPLAEGGFARLNRYVLTRDEFQVKYLRVMQDVGGYRIPADEVAAVNEPGAPIGERVDTDQNPAELFVHSLRPVGEVGPVAGAGPAPANAELL